MKELSDIKPIGILYSLKSKPIFESNYSIETLIKYHTSEQLSEETLISDLRLIRKTTPLNELTDSRIGNIGEKACYNFLNELFKNNINRFNSHFKVTHLNNLRESFKPYDIE